jgi:type I restriction enzyme R subunit
VSTGAEFEKVERPFVDQLISMGWKYTIGNPDDPTAAGRQSFRDVLLLDDLRRALVRINVNDERREWLDDARVSTAVSALQRLGATKLMEANQLATEMLLNGTTVDGLPDWEGGRSRTVHYVDWEHPENNVFRVVNQFKLEEPGGQAHRHIVPDLVLFVNGIPLTVVECKSPNLSEPLEEAIDQLQRYSNQRAWLEGNEGNEKLFHTNQFMVATCFEQARVGTIGAQAVHFMEWKDTAPVPMDAVAASLGKKQLSPQELLVAGMLRPEILLDIVRHFTLFRIEEGRTIKIVTRYQQYRAVHAAIERLLTGKTRAQDGQHDRRGGIIWHTQGSGKSLAMVFLVRKMRSMSELRRFKVVIVTDRKDLQKQLGDTVELSGENVRVARSIAGAKRLLAQKGPGLVFVMIQKYQERDLDPGEERDDADEAIVDTAAEVGEFPVLNEDYSILVLVDEAHRSHASAMHANLMRALPNCARIGFTGTPIIMGAKKRTHEIFGDFIDQYRLKQSEADGATVPILYEGRTAEGAVSDGRDLDEVFEDMLRGWTPEELERIKAKYATRGQVMEAQALIDAKARDILRHYVENILPNGYKAQLVAVSRRAAIRYQMALATARDELVAEVESLEPGLVGLSDDELAELPKRKQFLVRAQRSLPRLQQLEFAAVISGAHTDPPEWTEWTDSVKVKARIAAFKKPFPSDENDDPKTSSNLAFLIVKSMLLTGFDAPIEQVMYLDRYIKEAELLQAIARVNRPCGEAKHAGMVVDYFGVARHLKEALAVYAAEDIEGTLQDLKDEIPKLRDRHLRAVDFFESRDVETSDVEACIELLVDERLRAEFHMLLKTFLVTLDLVMPRPEALPYLKDAKTLGDIQMRARNRYRSGERPIGQEVGAKVRELIDEHIVSLGIDPKIPPLEITDAKFDAEVAKLGSPRARASEMEHALRYHIRKHLDEDPELYERLSKRLDRILAEFKDRWDQLAVALTAFTEEAQAGRGEDESGLDPETEGPFFGVLTREVAGDVELTGDDLEHLVEVTRGVLRHLRKEIALTDFWKKTHAQDGLRNWIVQYLDGAEVLPFERLPEVADRLVELARVNHDRLVRHVAPTG